MDKRGFDIAITTIVLIIIGVAVLVGLIFFVKGGFSFFDKGTKPILKAQNIEGARVACDLLCKAENQRAFCCEKVGVEDDNILCSDSILNVKCNINCDDFVCG